MKKVIIYCRVSSLKQSIYGLSLEDQEYRLIEYCKTRGWEVVQIVREIYPARNFERPCISEIIKEMKHKTKRFDVIICISFDRFSRDVATAEEVMKILMDADIELFTFDKRYNLKTVAGRREYFNDAFRAMDDNLSRAEKAQSAVNQRMRMGYAPYRVGPGYKKISGNKHKDPLKRTESQTVFDEKTAHIFKEGFVIIASGAFSAEGARKHLREKFRLIVQKQTFLNILHNPFYMGFIKCKDHDGKAILVKGIHPALVSEGTWHLVQENIANRSRKVLLHKKRNPAYPLRGFLKCPSCGEKLSAAGSRSQNGTYFHYYSCQRKKKKCTFNFRIDVAHELFSRVLGTFQFGTGIQKAYRSILESAFATEDAARTNRIRELEEMKNQNILITIESVKLLAEKTIDKEEYDLLLSNLKSDKKTYENELFEKEKLESCYEEYMRTNSNAIQNFKTFFWSADIDCQYQLLDTIIEGGITVEKNSIKQLELNPNFMRLLGKAKVCDDHGESSYLQQSVQ